MKKRPRNGGAIKYPVSIKLAKHLHQRTDVAVAIQIYIRIVLFLDTRAHMITYI